MGLYSDNGLPISSNEGEYFGPGRDIWIVADSIEELPQLKVGMAVRAMAWLHKEQWPPVSRIFRAPWGDFDLTPEQAKCLTRSAMPGAQESAGKREIE